MPFILAHLRLYVLLGVRMVSASAVSPHWKPISWSSSQPQSSKHVQFLVFTVMSLKVAQQSCAELSDRQRVRRKSCAGLEWCFLGAARDGYSAVLAATDKQQSQAWMGKESPPERKRPASRQADPDETHCVTYFGGFLPLNFRGSYSTCLCMCCSLISNWICLPILQNSEFSHAARSIQVCRLAGDMALFRVFACHV